MDIHTVTATSNRLRDAGVDHIVLADGRILVTADRESSRKKNQLWRKSAEYKQYRMLQKKYANKIGIPDKKAGKEGGHTLRKNAKGKYELVKLTAEELQGLKNRRKSQRSSTRMRGEERHNEKREAAREAERIEAERLAKKAARKAGKVAPVAPKSGKPGKLVMPKVGTPSPKSGKVAKVAPKPVKKVAKKMRD